MTRTFNLLRRIAGYAPKKERRAIEACASQLPKKIDFWDEFEILKNATPPLALFFLGDATINISPYGSSYSMYLITLPDGKRRHLTNELMHGGFEPKCEKLRDFFVGMETLIRCGCVIKGIVNRSRLTTTAPLSRENVSDYCRSSGATREIDLIHRIMDSRNTFCHSLVEPVKIEYDGVPLALSFSKSHFYRNCDRHGVDEELAARIRYFDEDAFASSEKLLKAFRSEQHLQLDVKKLARAVNSFNASLAGDGPTGLIDK